MLCRLSGACSTTYVARVVRSPLRSTAVLARFHAAAAGRVALIGAGGVADGAGAYAKIRAGARAVDCAAAVRAVTPFRFSPPT